MVCVQPQPPSPLLPPALARSGARRVFFYNCRTIVGGNALSLIVSQVSRAAAARHTHAGAVDRYDGASL